jgi:uncharacterized membrane protein YkvA (DUF1232 family)
MVILTLLYIASPVDVVPDFLVPGVGYLDDMTLLLLMGYYFIRWSPQEAVMEHVEAMGRSFRRRFYQWWSRSQVPSSRVFPR